MEGEGGVGRVSASKWRYLSLENVVFRFQVGLVVLALESLVQKDKYIVAVVVFKNLT